VPVRQQALTVVAPIPKASQAGIGAKLSAVQTDVCNALGTVKSLHFARFVVLSGADLPSEAASRLAFESNYDGELAAHLADLARALAPFDALLAEAWAGYTPGSFAAFAQKQSLPPATYYLGHPGLSALQILNDQSLRDRLETLLDAEEAAGRVKGRTAISVREALLAGLGGGFVTGPVDRGLPKQPESEAEFDLVIAVVVVLALFVLPMSVYVEWRERHTEPPAELISEDDPKLDAIAASEDAFALNGLTHHVPLRPGRFRRIALRLVLWFLEQAASKAAYKGTLGGISSIHFARRRHRPLLQQLRRELGVVPGRLRRQGARLPLGGLEQHQVVPAHGGHDLRRRVQGGHLQAVGPHVPGAKPDLVLGLRAHDRLERARQRHASRGRGGPDDRRAGARLARAPVKTKGG
jgi:hypothetical protein